MNVEEKSLISIQKNQVFDSLPVVELTSACSMDSGLIVLSEDDKKKAVKAFNDLSEEVSYFIPASGSGSRMFNVLHEFIETGQPSKDSTLFFNELKKLALYQKLSLVTREKLEKVDLMALARYLVHKEGLNLSDTPKGLIAFHQVNNTVLNPFQEHALQASRLFPMGVKIHFTVDKEVEEEVMFSINGLGNKNLNNLKISFSIQDKSTDAYCFNENQEVVMIDGELLRRPAGHGALINNLNKLDAELVLIKNIDNVQHINRCNASNEVAMELLGTVKVFQKALLTLKKNFSIEGLKGLNDKYEWLSSEVLDSMTEEAFDKMLLRPTRVCGMVKNEGAPGGGPFWLKGSSGATKQIIEKDQISSDSDQQKILAVSGYFNPVLIAALTTDIFGAKLDLNEFSNNENYLNVKKTHKGKTIYYRELPGLWNGGMFHWNTIFVEVPSKVFSPVKSVLDLLTLEHQA